MSTESYREDLEQLMQLQQLDSHVYEMARLERELPKALDVFRNDLQQAEDALQSFEAKIAEQEAEVRRLEREVKLEEERIQKSNEKLMAVKTNEEYHAALKEIERAKATNKQCEDRILEIMEAVEQLQAEKTTYAEAVTTKAKTLKEKSHEVGVKCTEAKNAQVGLEDKRKNFIVRIQDAGLLKTYETLRKKMPQAIVQIYSEFCECCQMAIPPKLFYQVQSMKSVNQCPNCLRILYWHPEAEKSAQTAAEKK